MVEADIYYLYLDRGEPEREMAGSVFNQDSNEALERSIDDSVNDDGSMFFAIGTRVLEIKATGLLEVELDGAHLPLSA